MAECSYALTGLGAAIAPGSQKWKGNWADLVKAPRSTRRSAGRVERVTLDGGGLGAEGRQLQGARDFPEEEEAGEEGEAARAGHEKGLEGALARLLLLVVEADEEVGADARQLPEDEERDRVVGEHEAEHRGHEEEGRRAKAAQPWVALEVAAAVNEDEGADAGDEEREQEREPVEAEGEADAEAGHPGPGLLEGLPGGGGAEEAGEVDEEEGRSRGEDDHAPASRARGAPSGRARRPGTGRGRESACGSGVRRNRQATMAP